MGSSSGKQDKAADKATTPATTDIKIHMMPMSMNAAGPCVLAMDLGIGKPEQCDIMSGANKKPEYLKIHPYGQIPGLQEGDFGLGESNAILRYMALKYGQKYYPTSDPKLCGKIDFAMDAFANVYSKQNFIVYKVFGFGGENDDQPTKNQEYTDASSKWFEIHVPKGKKFVGGDSLTIADFKVAPFFFAAIQPVMKEKTGFEPPPRVVQFCKDFIAAVKASELLSQAGGLSIKEFALSKSDAKAPLEGFPEPSSAKAAGKKGFKPVPGEPGSAKVADSPQKPAKKKKQSKKEEDEIAAAAAKKKEEDEKPGVKIHMMGVSMNSLGAVLVAQELGIGEPVICDLMAGAHQTPEFEKLNPYKQIPALEQGDYSLGESSSILRYMALAYGQKYYPVEDPQLCGRIDFAMDAFASVYSKHAFVVYKVFGFGGENDDQPTKNQEYTDAISKWFEIHVPKGKKFVGGDSLTIADFKVAPFFYSAIQPVMKINLGFEPPAVAVEYCENFMSEVKASKIMEEAGGYSIKEYAASKEQKADQPRGIFSCCTSAQGAQ